MVDVYFPGTRTQKSDQTSKRRASGSKVGRFFDNWINLVSVIVLSILMLFALFGQFLTPWGPQDVDWDALENMAVAGAPSILNGHYFGVNAYGHDMFALLVVATRVSLTFAALTALTAVTFGALSGIMAGYFGGWVDSVLLWANELAQSLPFIVVVVLWQAYLGDSLVQTLIVIALVTWPKMFMLARGQALILKNKEYIAAAQIIGLSHIVIIRRHILPNMTGVFFVGLSLTLPSIVVIESLLSFLNMGLPAPWTNWGTLLSEGVLGCWSNSHWQFIFPALIYATAQISFYYLGDGLRCAFDPKEP